MARFILDVANCDHEKVNKILYDLLEDSFLGKELVRITVIDETNDSQFCDNAVDDVLTEKQIENYNQTLKELDQ